jgi:hypothetical protein
MTPAERLLEATGRFLEADLRRRKARLTRALERDLERQLGRLFRRQGAALLRRLPRIRGRIATVPRETTELAEALREEDWAPLFDEATLETLVVMRTTIERTAGLAVLAGGQVAIAELSIAMSFTLEHPAAVRYLDGHAAALVTGINATTRSELARLLSAAAAEGTSYTAVAREIRATFDGFAKTRATTVAVTEIGDAYEAGNRAIAKTLTDVGLEVEKSWLDVGDRRVDPVCASNAAEGWIPIDQPFGSGHQAPTAHPSCRCTTEYRRKGSGI